MKNEHNANYKKNKSVLNERFKKTLILTILCTSVLGFNNAYAQSNENTMTNATSKFPSFIDLKNKDSITINDNDQSNILCDDLNIFISDTLNDACFNTSLNKTNLNKNLIDNIFEQERLAQMEKDKKDAIAKEAENVRKNLLKYVLNYDNARNTELEAIKLHGGDSKNTCVFFACEAIRRSNFFIPDWVGNTTDFTSQLESMGWHKVYDMSKLRPGDICFTMDEKNEKGAPTHTFIFVKWQRENKTAWTIDNQNQDSHIRNMTEQDGQYGPFQYFLTKDPYVQ